MTLSKLDLATTAKLFRGGGGDYTSEIVTLIGNGLWDRSRQYKARLVQDPPCPTCFVQGRCSHHILWDCPRDGVFSGEEYLRTVLGGAMARTPLLSVGFV